MDSIKNSIDELTKHFNSKMAEFQQNLQSASPATTPTSNLVAQFQSFRSFVLSALQGLQMQVSLLSKQHDDFEMRSRRKILLVHGIPEVNKEKLSSSVIKSLSDKLSIPDLSEESVCRCHRLGNASGVKPRAVLVKFKTVTSRNQIWYAKTGLKNSGITLSEFLTKDRHETFMSARQRFGISNCWTKNGRIIVIGPDGLRHEVLSKSELDDIPEVTVPQILKPSEAPGSSGVTLANPTRAKLPQIQRSKRNFRK